MKTIIEGNARVIALLGSQGIKDTNYRLMRYAFREKCEDGTLLHNVISGKLILLDEMETKELDDISGIQINSCSGVISKLIENYYLVPEDYNEKNTVNELRLLLRRLYRPKGISHYTILPTTSCNARCFYCYESNYQKISMPLSLAEKVVDFIDSNKPTNKVSISWFGGEPLVGEKCIDRICFGLKNRGIEYESSMTSNGYLFDEEIIDKAFELWKLKNIKITLDGTEDIYNRAKAFVNADKSPFKRVTNNIKELLNKGIKVSIRINLDQNNVDDLKALVDELILQFGSFNGMTIDTHVIFKDLGFSPIPRNETIERSLYEKQIELNDYIHEERGGDANYKIPMIRTYCCMIDYPGSIIIYPDGRLFKCNHNISTEEQIGTVLEGIKESPQYQLDNVVKWNRCEECVLFPKCLISNKCPCLADYNEYTCENEIQNRRKDIIRYYEKQKLS